MVRLLAVSGVTSIGLSQEGLHVTSATSSHPTVDKLSLLVLVCNNKRSREREGEKSILSVYKGPPVCPPMRGLTGRRPVFLPAAIASKDALHYITCIHTAADKINIINL